MEKASYNRILLAISNRTPYENHTNNLGLCFSHKMKSSPKAGSDTRLTLSTLPSSWTQDGYSSSKYDVLSQ